MSFRASVFGPGRPGGPVEGYSDIMPPDRSYAAVPVRSPLKSLFALPNVRETSRTGPVVTRKNRMKGIIAHRLDAPDLIPAVMPQGPGYGFTRPSVWQPVGIRRSTWIENRSLYCVGYPRNLGLTFKAPDPPTSPAGAAGPAMMNSFPFVRGVQNVTRPQAAINVYPTQGAGR